MKVGVIGLGSMGKRRIRLLKAAYPEYDIIGIDSREDRRTEVEEQFGITTLSDLEKAIDEYELDAIVVSTGPLAHSGIISTALKNNCHVFTEINLVTDGYDENVRLSKQKNKVLFISSTPMYRKEIEYIGQAVKNASKVNYIYHVGQYLPTWHVWESYKDFFVGNKRTNGCREIFAIELPWMIDTFGKVVEFSGTKGNMTTLDIDYADNYILNVTHESGAKGSISFNVASIRAVRNLEIYGDDLYLQWNGTPDTLSVFDSDDNNMKKVELYESVEKFSKQNITVIEDAYTAELVEFFDIIRNDSMPKHSFEKDKEILELIDRFEQEL